jgi:hypothetical protein
MTDDIRQLETTWRGALAYAESLPDNSDARHRAMNAARRAQARLWAAERAAGHSAAGRPGTLTRS